MMCQQCRKPLEEEKKTIIRKPGKGCPSIVKVSALPMFLTLSVVTIHQIRTYQKIASEKRLSWNLLDSQAQAIMRRNCAFCGRAAKENSQGINGINRIDHSIPAYTLNNTAPACSDCNQMKHNHSQEDFVAICKHVATANGLGDFGRYPEAFRDNFMPKRLSGYLTKSKTYALSQEDFQAIVAKPCHYCGKETIPGKHYNGLDRVVTQVRVYNKDSCVAACGTCNTMKWRRTSEDFLAQCNRVALYHSCCNSSEIS
ncbi:hypothetical protein GUITHDRAFT_99054 [Guillardia theta CCMP2712]|uniref:Uncharacterized protein n=1 Tax=Guillardia theta (strain CCMP2712) TaxID=905079 RepID=L1K4L6_GUITC|nr:hypothetical protein GUITHDRAFT_99054 [Guillardia theta CCMP2712]EKX55273.1 hypothetical protein GUITHDRAFT_99054 [Guillardia theta CCMP2712]|eukprot:XP_005842253.1 hypothetical protein GUITHDRAFT_99054 [Guillardia theta CCMP2712]